MNIHILHVRGHRGSLELITPMCLFRTVRVPEGPFHPLPPRSQRPQGHFNTTIQKGKLKGAVTFTIVQQIFTGEIQSVQLEST